MNGGRPIHVMRMPLKTPTPSPDRRPEAIATGMENPCRNANAVISDERPSTDPTERSIPPVTMAITMPIAVIAVNENERKYVHEIVDGEKIGRRQTD